MRDTELPSTVRIGGADKPALLQALREHGVELNQAGAALFADPRFTTLEEATEIPIASVSVAGLGFPQGATYGQLMAQARQVGLAPCPVELAPHLRLQYLHQPEGAIGFPATRNQTPPGAVVVASVPLDEEDETPKGFYLRRIEGVPWLRGYRSWAGHVHGPEEILVFARACGEWNLAGPRP